MQSCVHSFCMLCSCVTCDKYTLRTVQTRMTSTRCLVTVTKSLLRRRMLECSLVFTRFACCVHVLHVINTHSGHGPKGLARPSQSRIRAIRRIQRGEGVGGNCCFYHMVAHRMQQKIQEDPGTSKLERQRQTRSPSMDPERVHFQSEF